MVTRTRRLKYDQFGKTSDQIVAAQAKAEKLRARDGPSPTPELEKVLGQISHVR